MIFVRFYTMANLIIQRMFSTSTSLKNVFNHVTVIGGGLMGSGIAQVTAQSGMDVTVVEVNTEAVKRSTANIKNSLGRVAKKLFQNKPTEAEKYISDTMARLKISTNLKEVVETTDLIIEAIIENIDMKHKLFSKLDIIAPQHTIFTSNTSSLSITNIAAVTKRQDRFGGLHFFNPVPVMKLLEVIRTESTSEETYQKLLSWGKAIGKTCITCKDTPGFVVNRLLIPYLAEAIRMLERGDASARDIDIAMKLGAGYPMGPLELLDYVGLDTTKFILDGWHKKNPDHPLFQPISLLEKLVSEGKMGRKTGEGFYTYKIGNPNMPVHTSFLKPLVAPALKTSSVGSEKTKPEKPLDQMSKPIRKIKAEKIEKIETFEDPHQTHSEGKLKKIARFKNLEQWKNADEFIKFERDKPPMYLRKPSGRRLAKQIENYVSRDIFKCSEKFKNFQEFIKFEREKNFRTFDS